MNRRLACSAASVFGLLASAGPAFAHIYIDYPPVRNGDQKTGPCEGIAKGESTEFSPGETITVSWMDAADHDPSYYRISFDMEGEDDFVDPAAYEDFYTNETVLADNIPDQPGNQSHTFELTLPNVQCETCTLQIIQVMGDKPPYGNGNDIYYRCADIALRGTPAPDAGPGAPDAMPPIGDSDAMSGGGGADAMPPDNGGGGDDGGCQVGGSGGGIPAALLLVVVFAAFVLRRPTAPRSPG